MSDETDADLFIEAQDTVWASVVSELTAGQKSGHWMWFVFPQLASLGQSDMSQLFGLHDLDEARAFLAHPELRDGWFLQALFYFSMLTSRRKRFLGLLTR